MFDILLYPCLTEKKYNFLSMLTTDKNLFSFFNGLLSGVLVWDLNGKYFASSRPSGERHTTGWACYDTDYTSLM
jgi:hypothetical protein